VGRGFAAGEIEHADAAAFGLELENGPGGAQFGVVGMRGDHEYVEHDAPWGMLLAALAGERVTDLDPNARF
jgi:hypothetical protein